MLMLENSEAKMLRYTYSQEQNAGSYANEEECTRNQVGKNKGEFDEELVVSKKPRPVLSGFGKEPSQRWSDDGS